MSRAKNAEIITELDTLHISTLRIDGDYDRQALWKVIEIRRKHSLIGTDYYREDDPKSRWLRNAIAQEQWANFALSMLTVLQFYEEMVSIPSKLTTDLSVFECQRKDPPSAATCELISVLVCRRECLWLIESMDR